MIEFEYISPLDMVFSPVYQLVFKHKPLEWYFTNTPDFLAYDVIEEFMASKALNSQKENADRMRNDLKNHLVKLIINKKEKEKQLTLLTIGSGDPLRDKLIQEIKINFPRAFIKRFKQTRNRYGVVQAILDLSQRRPVAPLVETLDFSDFDFSNNPLMFV